MSCLDPITRSIASYAQECASAAQREIRGRFVQRISDLVTEEAKRADDARKRYTAARSAVELDAGEDPDASAHVTELRNARHALVAIESKLEGLKSALAAVRDLY